MPEWPEMAIGPQNIRDQGMMGGPPERPELAIAPKSQKSQSPGNCIIIGPGIYFLDRIVENFGANNFGFHPKTDIL